MTTEQRNENAKSTSMAKADVANGEAPDTESKHDESPRHEDAKHAAPPPADDDDEST